MFSPRDLELLQVVGEVMRERIGEVRGAYEAQIKGLTEKVAALEARPTELGLKLSEDELGAAFEKALSTWQPPEPAPPDLSPLVERISALEARPVSHVTTDTLEGFIADCDKAVERRLAALPAPLKGDKGDPGPGVTAEDFRPLFEAEIAKAELAVERRVMDLVQRTLDKIPLPSNGKDGVGFDDLTITRDGRTIRHEYRRDGAVVKTFEFKTDELQYREIYKAGEAYERGDVVTWDGSIWIARSDTPGKPGEGDGWRLAVKRGRDGRPGEPGKKGDPGKPGKNGLDLTHSMRGSVVP